MVVFYHIWLVEILVDHPQLLHCKLSLPHFSSHFYTTFIYAKCSRADRVFLSDALRVMIPLSSPCMVGGDFNTITSTSEREGGAPPNLMSINDFNSCIEDYSLLDVGFIGPAFTWFGPVIAQRLDRILLNQQWIDFFKQNQITHQLRRCSDHRPRLLFSSLSTNKSISSFRFQHMWTKHTDFQFLVKGNWDLPYHQTSGLTKFAEKLYRLKQLLRWWNKNIFGNVFTRLKKKEAAVIKAEVDHNLNPTLSNKEKYKTLFMELDNLLDLEEDYWRQKSRSNWILEGERNTKLFHIMVQRKRNHLKILSITAEDGSVLTDSILLKNSVVTHFDQLLTSAKEGTDMHLPSLLSLIPYPITGDMNALLTALATWKKSKAQFLTSTKMLQQALMVSLPISIKVVGTASIKIS